MQRDFDLVRKLLIFLDEKSGPEHVQIPDIEGQYTDLQIKYHLVLLHQAGFVSCEPVKSSTSDRIIYVVPFDLTWEGHEFLAKIRDRGVWDRIQAVITSKGGTLAFAVVNQIATKLALSAAGF